MSEQLNLNFLDRSQPQPLRALDKTRREGRHDEPAATVLHEVDVDTAPAARGRADDGGDLRNLRDRHARDELTEQLALVVGEAATERHEDVHPGLAAGLRVAGNPDLFT